MMLKIHDPIIYSSFRKTIGLMFKKKLTQPYLFIFQKEKTIYIHTFFCRQPIDMIFLDKQKRVIEIKTNVRPWTYLGKITNVSYMIEAKSGWFSTVNINDEIYW